MSFERFEKMLKECEEKGDSKGRAAILFEMAKMKISEGDQEEALLLLMEAFSRFKDQEDLSGVCFTGELLGQLLFVSGNRDDGLRMIRESLAGFNKMGLPVEVERTEELLAAMEAHAAENPLSSDNGQAEA